MTASGLAANRPPADANTQAPTMARYKANLEKLALPSIADVVAAVKAVTYT